jgi:hypothetical protein
MHLLMAHWTTPPPSDDYSKNISYLALVKTLLVPVFEEVCYKTGAIICLRNSLDEVM